MGDPVYITYDMLYEMLKFYMYTVLNIIWLTYNQYTNEHIKSSFPE